MANLPGLGRGCCPYLLPQETFVVGDASLSSILVPNPGDHDRTPSDAGIIDVGDKLGN